MEKKPFVTKEQIEQIVKTYPTPFHIYDEAGIRKNCEAVKEAFSWNKGFREYFAVKATPNPYIMNILKDYDIGFDCSSEAELVLSGAVKASGDHIMFSSNDTPACEYKLAYDMGAIINLDDITHIEFLDDKIGKALLDIRDFDFGQFDALTGGDEGGILAGAVTLHFGDLRFQCVDALSAQL